MIPATWDIRSFELSAAVLAVDAARACIATPDLFAGEDGATDAKGVVVPVHSKKACRFGLGYAIARGVVIALDSGEDSARIDRQMQSPNERERKRAFILARDRDERLRSIYSLLYILASRRAKEDLQNEIHRVAFHEEAIAILAKVREEIDLARVK